MVQRLRICLPVPGTRFDPWSRKYHMPRGFGALQQLLSMCSTTREITTVTSPCSASRELPPLAATRESLLRARMIQVSQKKKKVLNALSTCQIFFCVSSLVKVNVAQSCLTLCDPMDHTVRAILQARILEWVAFPFSRGSSQPRD